MQIIILLENENHSSEQTFFTIYLTLPFIFGEGGLIFENNFILFLVRVGAGSKNNFQKKEGFFKFMENNRNW